ncbi:MAG: hypothetical protein JXB30_04680 [Anaerolineae bacterium]|nr:hypothetical protein [Anaerolineae bacterium]
MSSRITERQEKGFGPISFKRLLFAGGSGALGAMALTRIVGFFPGCVGAISIALLVVILTHPIEGLALNAFLLRSVRSLLTISALDNAENNTVPGPITQLLKVSPEDGQLEADKLFEVEWEDEEDELPPQTLVYKGGFANLGKTGLAVVDNPFFVRGNGRSDRQE